MNERLPDDELVSSVLDDEADAGAHALVDGDPVLQQRLAAFQQVSTTLKSPTSPPDAALREQAISAALAASTVGIATSDGAGADVVPLAGRGRSPWLLAAAAAAALVVLLPLGFLVASNVGDSGSGTGGEVATGLDDDGDGVNVTPRSTTPTTSGDPDTGQGNGSDERSPGPQRGVVAHLGDLPDTAAVAAAVASYSGPGSSGQPGETPSQPPATTPVAPSPEPTSPPSTSPPSGPTEPAPTEPGPVEPGPAIPAEEMPCPDTIPGLGPVELVASASYQGIPAIIVVTGTDPDRHAYVIEIATCLVIAEVTL